jgi:hypothetical protein
VDSDVSRGYLRELYEYLADALATNPKCGGMLTGRTVLYGLQTPPRNGQLSVLRCSTSDSVDDVAPPLFPFLLTSASEMFSVSVDPANESLVETLQAVGVEKLTLESDDVFKRRVGVEKPFNIISSELLSLRERGYPLVGQLISLLMSVGHVKSVAVDDEVFVHAFSSSPKWLTMRRSRA